MGLRVAGGRFACGILQKRFSAVNAATNLLKYFH